LEVIESGLQATLDRSTPDTAAAAAAGGGSPTEEDEESEDGVSSKRLPWWRLQVSGQDLPSLVNDQLTALTGDSEGALTVTTTTTTSSSSSSNSPAAAQLVHLQQTWRLVQVLFEELAPWEASPGSDLGADEAMNGFAGSPMSNASSRMDPGGLYGSGSSSSGSGAGVLPLKRRAAVSRWLQSAVKPEVEAALQLLLQHQQGGSSSNGAAAAAGGTPGTPLLGSSSSSSGAGRQQQQQPQGGALLWAVLQLLAGHQVGREGSGVCAS
jgi:hypothetical protein